MDTLVSLCGKLPLLRDGLGQPSLAGRRMVGLGPSQQVYPTRPAGYADQAAAPGAYHAPPHVGRRVDRFPQVIGSGEANDLIQAETAMQGGIAPLDYNRPQGRTRSARGG
jgi:hypothetical protein